MERTTLDVARVHRKLTRAAARQTADGEASVHFAPEQVIDYDGDGDDTVIEAAEDDEDVEARQQVHADGRLSMNFFERSSFGVDGFTPLKPSSSDSTIRQQQTTSPTLAQHERSPEPLVLLEALENTSHDVREPATTQREVARGPEEAVLVGLPASTESTAVLNRGLEVSETESHDISEAEGAHAELSCVSRQSPDQEEGTVEAATTIGDAASVSDLDTAMTPAMEDIGEAELTSQESCAPLEPTVPGPGAAKDESAREDVSESNSAGLVEQSRARVARSETGDDQDSEQGQGLAQSERSEGTTELSNEALGTSLAPPFSPEGSATSTTDLDDLSVLAEHDSSVREETSVSAEDLQKAHWAVAALAAELDGASELDARALEQDLRTDDRGRDAKELEVQPSVPVSDTSTICDTPELLLQSGSQSDLPSPTPPATTTVADPVAIRAQAPSPAPSNHSVSSRSSELNVSFSSSTSGSSGGSAGLQTLQEKEGATTPPSRGFRPKSTAAPAPGGLLRRPLSSSSSSIASSSSASTSAIPAPAPRIKPVVKKERSEMRDATGQVLPQARRHVLAAASASARAATATAPKAPAVRSSRPVSAAPNLPASTSNTTPPRASATVFRAPQPAGSASSVASSTTSSSVTAVFRPATSRVGAPAGSKAASATFSRLAAPRHPPPTSTGSTSLPTGSASFARPGAVHSGSVAKPSNVENALPARKFGGGSTLSSRAGAVGGRPLPATIVASARTVGALAPSRAANSAPQDPLAKVTLPSKQRNESLLKWSAASRTAATSVGAPAPTPASVAASPAPRIAIAELTSSTASEAPPPSVAPLPAAEPLQPAPEERSQPPPVVTEGAKTLPAARFGRSWLYTPSATHNLPSSNTSLTEDMPVLPSPFLSTRGLISSAAVAAASTPQPAPLKERAQERERDADIPRARLPVPSAGRPNPFASTSAALEVEPEAPQTALAPAPTPPRPRTLMRAPVPTLTERELKRLTSKHTLSNAALHNMHVVLVEKRDVPRPPSPSSKMRSSFSEGGGRPTTKKGRDERAQRRGETKRALRSSMDPSEFGGSADGSDFGSPDMSRNGPPKTHFRAAGDDEGGFFSPARKPAVSSGAAGVKGKAVKWDRALVYEGELPEEVKKATASDSTVKGGFRPAALDLDSLGNVIFPVARFKGVREQVQVLRVIYADDE